MIILRLPNLVYLGKLDERASEWDGDARADFESVLWRSSVEVRGLEGGDIKSMGDRGGVPDDLLGDANGADVEILGDSGTCWVLCERSEQMRRVRRGAVVAAAGGT